jgi:glycerol-3-phosphate acyltransferase PlsY
VSYLLGSINTAVIVTRIATKGKQDIREMGSGNAGFTNVLRSVGKTPAYITMACDILKAVISVALGGIIFGILSVGNPDADYIISVAKYICGFACILGHSYPIYFHFRGGKGILTSAGMMLVLDWRVFLMILGTFLLVFICSKIISLASLTCAALYGFYTFILAFFVDKGSTLYVTICTVIAFGIGAFVIIKHKDNIKRLIRGEEKKITAKK